MTKNTYENRFVDAISQMVRETCNYNCSNDIEGGHYLIQLSNKITENPRQDENYLFALCLLICIIGLNERLYGKVEDLYTKDVQQGKEISIFDKYEIYFWDQYRSQLYPKYDNFDKTIVCISSEADTWEKVFYEMCHESIHILNPRLVEEDSGISTLEEGVAVKFAENMYEKYIAPYTDERPISPINEKESQYYDAFHATNKIPDTVLKIIRTKFGKFSTINNKQTFFSLISEYVTESECEILCRNFDYFSY